MRICSLRGHRLKQEWNRMVWSVNNLRCGTAGRDTGQGEEPVTYGKEGALGHGLYVPWGEAPRRLSIVQLAEHGIARPPGTGVCRRQMIPCIGSAHSPGPGDVHMRLVFGVFAPVPDGCGTLCPSLFMQSIPIHSLLCFLLQDQFIRRRNPVRK